MSLKLFHQLKFVLSHVFLRKMEVYFSNPHFGA